MTATAKHISDENLDARLSVSGPDDELKELGNTFDGMLGRLQGAFESQRRFVHHNVPGGLVRISSGSDGKWARLVVENTGPVLEQERLAQLGEPFYRPGTERMANGNGSGLGISIAKAVATAHGGNLVLNARPGGGLRAVIELPVRLGP